MQQYFEPRIFFIFYYNILHWFYANGENLCKDICNRKKELKAKGEIIKRKRNYEKVDKNIWRVLKCKEIATLRDFL